jgi:hypothetical protein
MGKKNQAPDRGSGMNIPDHISALAVRRSNHTNHTARSHPPALSIMDIHFTLM